MIKYLDWAITFAEIPSEVSLCLEITNCPHRCMNCHSPQLRDNVGDELSTSIIDELVKKYSYITCICFMGGDNNHKDIIKLTKYIHDTYKNIKVAMYSGNTEVDSSLMCSLDYYKIGPYIEELGPLNKKSTNQKLYRKNPDNSIEDITYKFWAK